LQKHQDKLIETFNLKNQKEVAELKQDVKAKDIQINNLKQKEGLLQGKDDMIAKLTGDIEKLAQ
jgi:cell division protein FtsB